MLSLHGLYWNERRRPYMPNFISVRAVPSACCHRSLKSKSIKMHPKKSIVLKFAHSETTAFKILVAMRNNLIKSELQAPTFPCSQERRLFFCVVSSRSRLSRSPVSRELRCQISISSLSFCFVNEKNI